MHKIDSQETYIVIQCINGLISGRQEFGGATQLLQFFQALSKSFITRYSKFRLVVKNNFFDIHFGFWNYFLLVG